MFLRTLSPLSSWLIAVLIVVELTSSTTHTKILGDDESVTKSIDTDSDKDLTNSNNNHQESEGWSNWSSWSTCSRSCNGGVTYQLRKCVKKPGCEGEEAKYRICNMQPCPVSDDFRASQCALYNNKPYRGRLYEWLPYQDPEDPCSLTCHAKAFSFVAKLASNVRDGTRCREGSLDMCVKGKCLPVGCDLQLGSNKKVDECGVCGGDGTTCKRPVYLWEKTPFSPCSVSCGGGYQMSRPTCLNKANDKEVDERLCDVTLRPRPQIRECNTDQCAPVWITDSWSPCSATCGGGRQSRQVHCSQMGTDGIRTHVGTGLCLKQKPAMERPCNVSPCPQWSTGPWSGCSVTCGKGHKSRPVTCQDVKGQHSIDCDVEVMPSTKMDCDSGLICTPSEDPGSYLFSDIFKGSQEDAPPPHSAPYQSFPWKQKLPAVSTEPSYVAGDWGQCSSSCGHGKRKRKVDCKIFLEFSRTVAKLPDKECPGPRPPDVESCFIMPCSLDQNKVDIEKPMKNAKGHVGIEVTYSWRVSGFTPCSASCLGGIRESIVQCVRDHDHAVMLVTHCDITEKPDAITQTCNDHPCPPKWNVSDYTHCSKQCGGGIQTRVVQCLHEVTRGTANTLVVANDLCPQPPPRNQQFCNVFDCPSRWKPDVWTKCSKSCGGGEKTRKIRCLRELAFGQVVELSPSRCPKRRPKTQKLCNTKMCPGSDDDFRPKIYPAKHSFVQEKPQNRVLLEVGGTAVVFAGTHLKIKCQGKKDRTAISWYKDDQRIESSRKTKISMKGALRIRRVAYKDGGKYTCVNGNSKSDLYLTVKPSPFTDQDKTVERRPTTDTKTKGKVPEDVFSHERPGLVGKSTGQENTNDLSHIDANTALGGNRQVPDYDRTHEENKLNFGHKVYSGTRHRPDAHDHGSGGSKSDGSPGKYDISTLERVPLYVLAGQTTEKPPILTTEGTSDSDELFQQRGLDLDKDKPSPDDRSHPERNDISNLAKPIDSWEQRYDGSKRKPTPRPFDTWERNHGGALFSDQESGELNIGTPHHGKGFSDQGANSGASSHHGGSHIQKLLVNLHHTLGGSRSKGTYNAHDVEDMNAADEEDHGGGGTMNPSKFVSSSFVLGKGKAENLEFEWIVGEWTACSQSCGGTGFQVRASQCLVRLNNVSKTVDSSLCEDAGLKSPETARHCGVEDCPHWETSPWSQCLESQCFTWHSSYQKRNVFCRTANNTDLPVSRCEQRTRPRRKRECYNERCRSTWKVGEWSQCTASCRNQGFQSRILQCVWFGSSKPAGNACRDQQRPEVMRTCMGLPCESKESCTDHSNYCNIAKALHMCHLSHYHLQCCETCRNGMD